MLGSRLLVQAIRQKMAEAREELRRMDEYLTNIEGNVGNDLNPEPSHPKLVNPLIIQHHLDHIIA